MENVGIRRKGITGIMRKKAGYSSTTGIVLTAVLLTVLFLAACGSQPEDKKMQECKRRPGRQNQTVKRKFRYL